MPWLLASPGGPFGCWFYFAGGSSWLLPGSGSTYQGYGNRGTYNDWSEALRRPIATPPFADYKLPGNGPLQRILSLVCLLV